MPRKSFTLVLSDQSMERRDALLGFISENGDGDQVFESDTTRTSYLFIFTDCIDLDLLSLIWRGV